MDEPRNLHFHEWPMFNQVMTDEHDICRRILEVVLDQPVDRVESVEAEKTLEPRLGAKGVRLDAYVRTTGAVYDVEIQAYAMRSLGRRMRYYQSIMDSSELKRGQRYQDLVESYIVFLCTKDQFGTALPVYHFEVKCCEDDSIDARHGFHWLVLNASAWELLPEGRLRSLLRYVATEKKDGDSLVDDIAAAVARANGSAVWRQKGLDMLTYIEDARIQAELIAEEGYRDGMKRGLEDGRAEGRAEGLAEGHAEGLAEGREKGLAEGRAEGLAEGRSAGFQEGARQAEERMGSLIARLLEENRAEEVALAAANSETREALYAEFGL